MHAGNAMHRANVGRQERWLSLGAGAILTMLGLRRHSLLLGALGGGLLYRGSTGYCPVNAGIGRDSRRPGEQPLLPPSDHHLRSTITIERPLEQVYEYCRDLAHAPRYMHHVRAVTVDGDRARWIARVPGGRELEWETELTQDVSNDHLAWQSLAEQPLQHSGRIQLRPAPSGRGTEVELELSYRAPGGRIGGMLAGLFGSLAEIDLDDDLHRLRQLLETGEIATTAGQPTGASARSH